VQAVQQMLTVVIQYLVPSPQQVAVKAALRQVRQQVRLVVPAAADRLEMAQMRAARVTRHQQAHHKVITAAPTQAQQPITGVVAVVVHPQWAPQVLHPKAVTAVRARLQALVAQQLLTQAVVVRVSLLVVQQPVPAGLAAAVMAQ
jgi:hypothetical protein